MKSLLILFISFKLFALSENEAKHLLLRTGFDIQSSDIKALSKLDRKQAFQYITRNHEQYKKYNIPEWLKGYRDLFWGMRDLNQGNLNKAQIAKLIQDAKAYYQQVKDFLPENKTFNFDVKNHRKLLREIRKLNRMNLFALQVDWFEKILKTQSPFTEKMTIFWHNHFVSSLKKVKRADWMYQQLELLRSQSLGNFGYMLEHITTDPAMLKYLDGVKNNADAPNENYAREVMELFTLGQGHYSEKDIKEVARALTGLKINQQTGFFRFAKRKHDYGVKSFLGATGNFSYIDVVKILLSHYQTAIFITNKIWKEFISFTPNSDLVEKWAKVFRDSNYDINILMQTVLTSDEFYKEANRGALIKSPIEYTLGMLRQFQLSFNDWPALIRFNQNLCQSLYDPPNVKGWAGGKSWITTSTLLERQQFVRKFINYQQNEVIMGDKSDLKSWFESLDGKNKLTSARFTLLAIDDQVPLIKRNNVIRLLKEIMLKPHYQLK